MSRFISRPAPCLGIKGWLFGHQFIKMMFFAERYEFNDYCYRCGMPQGGWQL
jgi:hypothetical protein